MSADAYADTDAQHDTTDTDQPRAGAPSTTTGDPWRVQGAAPTVGDSAVTFDYRVRTRCPNGCDKHNQKI
ncbi:MAG: hypothetical protein ABEH90_06515 [Halolamina sp.]